MWGREGGDPPTAADTAGMLQFAVPLLVLSGCVTAVPPSGEKPCTVQTFYFDADGDGVGVETGTVEECAIPFGYAETSGDCDDADAGVSGELTWYADEDDDAFGDEFSTRLACDAPGGFVADATDCDDASAGTHPGADEHCDAADEDCDGTVDIDPVNGSTFYADATASPDGVEVCDDGIDQDFDTEDDACCGSVSIRDGIDVVRVCASTFDIGCTAGQGSCDADETVHSVTLTHDFYVGRTEVTQGDFEGTMGYNPSSFPACGADCPVERVSWHESAAYANALSTAAGWSSCYSCTGTGTSVSCTGAMDPYACGGYRLLTQAESEAAARCGEDLLYAGSVDIADVGWCSSNSGATTHAVASLDPNACDLYDMSGNVWEWTQDWHGTLTADAATDPTGEATGTHRVVRNGAWDVNATYARVSKRFYDTPEAAYDSVGLRIGRTLP